MIHGNSNEIKTVCQGLGIEWASTVCIQSDHSGEFLLGSLFSFQTCPQASGRFRARPQGRRVGCASRWAPAWMGFLNPRAR